MASRPLAILYTLLVVVAASVVSVLAKSVLSEVSAFRFVWLQLAMGGIALTVYARFVARVRIPSDLPRSVWFCIAWIGVANFAIVRLMFMLGLERLPAVTHVYLVNFTGVVTMVMSAMWLREPPSPVQILGGAVALLGLWVFFGHVPAPTELTGTLFVAIGVLGLSSVNIAARQLALRAGSTLPATTIGVLAFWLGGAPVVLAGVCLDLPLTEMRWEVWAVIAANGVVAIAVGPTVWNYVMRTLRAYEASVLATSAVVFTALFAIPFLGETLELRQGLGIGAMFLGLGLVQVRRSRARS